MMLCLPYGAICLTAFYLVFCLVIGTQLPECIVENEETDIENCGTEGVDNSVLAWSTSYFVANIIGFIALHIWWKSSKRVVGGIAFVGLAVAAVFNGIIARFFGNNGFEDGKGMKGFYVSTIVYHFLMTLSAFLLAFIGHQAWQQYDAVRPRCCGRTEMALFLVLLCISSIAVIFGCVTTLSYGDEVLVKNIFDEYPSDQYQVPLSLEVVSISTKIWNACYSLFLISLAIVLGMAAKVDPVKIGGLPNSLAAGGVVLLQGAVGVFRAVFLSISSSDDVKGSTVDKAAPAIFNYSLLMTAFFIHNLIVTLFPKDEDDLYSSKHGSQSSMENEEIDDVEAQQQSLAKNSRADSSNNIPRSSSVVTGYSQSEASGSVMTEQSSQRDWNSTLLPQSQGETSTKQIPKSVPHDDDTALESEGVEVMGIPATEEPKRTSPFRNVSTRFRSFWSKKREEAPTMEEGAEASETPDMNKDIAKAMQRDGNVSANSNTSFGSEILQKTKPVYKNGSLTSFGSEMLQKVTRVQPPSNSVVQTQKTAPSKPQTRQIEEQSETTFGSEVLHKAKPVYENGSQTTFGSEVLQKVGRVEPAMGKNIPERETKTSQAAAPTEESCTSFGSEVLHKMKKPDPVYEDTSRTTFGSETLQKVKKVEAGTRDSDSLTENPGIEVVGLPSPSPDKPTTSLLSRMGMSQKKAPKQEPYSISRKAMSNVMRQLDNDDEASETTFGSQVLKKVKPPAYESGSETSFGSQILQKVKGKQPVYQDASYTTFGSEVLQKTRPVYEDTSETTFGSQMLQKVKRVYHEDGAVMEDASVEVVGMANTQTSNRRLPMLNRLMQKKKNRNVMPATDDSSGSMTSFGSVMLQKAKKPEYESESEGTFTSFGSEQLMKLKPRRLRQESEDSLAGSSTTFGSQRLIKVKPTMMRYETDGSVTTFGSELLVKAKVEYRAYEPAAAAATSQATATTQASISNNASSRRVSAISTRDSDSERSYASSSQRAAEMAATDPAHLQNMDKVYNWMSKFIPVEGLSMSSSRKVSENSKSEEGVREEFEVKLGTFDADDETTEVGALEATSWATKVEEEEEEEEAKAPGIMSRLRPMRKKKKKSYRKQYQQTQQELDIPNAIEEDADEESTTASSTNKRHSNKADGTRKASQSKAHPAVEEKGNYAAPILTAVSEDAVAGVADVDIKPMEETDDRSQASAPRELRSVARSGGSFSSDGYSTDNTTILSTSSKLIVMTQDPLEGGIPQELAESRDDDYTTDSDEEDSVSYATSSAAPSEFQTSYLSDGVGGPPADNMSREASSVSSVYLNKAPLAPPQLMEEKGPAASLPAVPRARRERQASTLHGGWANVE